MKFNFDEFNYYPQPAIDEELMDNPEWDRFELLSAYLDGEVTAEERRQVQQWLDTDSQTKKLYTRLLRLRQDIETLPIPPAQQSCQQLTAQVFQRIDRQRRSQRLLLWGGIAIAAIFIGAISSLLPREGSPVQQIAEIPLAETNSESLIIALNHPVLEIPPEAISPKKERER
jgi:anti-sigma factor RsiW